MSELKNEWINSVNVLNEWMSEWILWILWLDKCFWWMNVRINDWIKECINVVINLTKECSNDWMLGMMNEYNLVKLFSES